MEKQQQRFLFGVALAKEGRKVLLVDADPQGNLTTSLGYYKQEDMPIRLTEIMNAEMMEEEINIKDGILHHKEGIDLIPSDLSLSGVELSLGNTMSREFILKNCLNKVKDNYDYVIIDCPPSLNMLTINAMTTADSVLVPIQCEYYALEGLSQLIHTVELVKERLNPVLEIEGVVFTMYDARTNLSLQVVENVKDNLQQNIYKTIIPRNIRLAEAPSYGMPINLYDSKSAGADSYMRLADEVMNRE